MSKWKRKLLVRAILSTLASVILIIALIVGGTGMEAEALIMPLLFALFFGVTGAVDWVRLSEYSSRRTPRRKSKRQLEKEKKLEEESARYRQAYEQKQAEARQKREEREQQQEAERLQQERELYISQEPYRQQKNKENTARRQAWLQKQDSLSLLLYNEEDPSKQTWLFGPMLQNGMTLCSYPGGPENSLFTLEDKLWYIQAKNGSAIQINGPREKQVSKNCADVEIESRLYGSKIPVLPGDCLTITNGKSVQTWYVTAKGFFPRYR